MGFKLGDKVQFIAHYEKTHNYFDAEDEDSWTYKQRQNWENEEPIIVERVKPVSHEPKTGFIAGKRNIVVQTSIEFHLAYLDGSGKYMRPCPEHTLRQVYLIATNMTGFYRVHPDWIKGE